MACPHSTAIGSTPQTCSQCMMATARSVQFDANTRKLMVDGSEVVRPTELEKTAPPNRGMITKSRRQRTCGICGQAGHSRPTCNRQVSDRGAGTEAMMRAIDEEDR